MTKIKPTVSLSVMSLDPCSPEALEGPHVLPAAAVEDEVGGGDLDGALRGDPAALVDHGHDEGVGVAVVDVAPVLGHGVQGQPDAVAVAHRKATAATATPHAAAVTLGRKGSCEKRRCLVTHSEAQQHIRKRPGRFGEFRIKGLA